MYIPEYEELKERINRIYNALTELQYLDSGADINEVLQDIDYLKQEVVMLSYTISALDTLIYSMKDPNEPLGLDELPSLKELLLERYPFLERYKDEL